MKHGFNESSSKEWPVKVYRCTHAKGWERIKVPSVSGPKMEEVLTAIPKRGSIEVKKLRIRIRLYQESKSSGKGSYPALVVRRLDTVLMSTRRGMGAVVLKFNNVEECLEFSGKFSSLNEDYNIVFDKANSKEDNKHEANSKQEKSAETRHHQQTNDILLHRQRDAKSYIARLLHDKEFLHYVDQIEEELATNEFWGIATAAASMKTRK